MMGSINEKDILRILFLLAFLAGFYEIFGYKMTRNFIILIIGGIFVFNANKIKTV